MNYTVKLMEKKKRIALVAHDAKKDAIVNLAIKNKDLLKYHKIYATGTTGRILSEKTGLKINRLKSGPLGGDQQLGAMISEGEIDLLIFLTRLRHTQLRAESSSSNAR